MNIKQTCCQLLVAAAFVLAGSANARLITYDFSVDGDWFSCCDNPPFGTNPHPSLAGQLTVNTDLADNFSYGYYSGQIITALSLVIGSKTWTFAEATAVENKYAFISGYPISTLTYFSVEFNSDDSSVYIASNNTFSFEDGLGQYNACNYCVTIENNGNPSDYHPLPVPEPETYAMFLAGLILMGFILRRKKLV